jgi:hypothetical protein
MIFTLTNEEIRLLNDDTSDKFPKYTSQLINCANQNAQGTRPKFVGQMSELFPEYVMTSDKVTLSGWREWYTERNPEAFDIATDRIYAQVENLKSAIQLIDRGMVRDWVEDLVISKTYNGLYVQEAVLAGLAKRNDCGYRMATPEEESRGIDGYVGNTAYSVKPDTYKTMDRLPEIIDVKMVFYTKTKTGLKIEIAD